MGVNVSLFVRTAANLAPGDLIHPGSWGRVLRHIGGNYAPYVKECLLDIVRRNDFPDRPSRLYCAFAFENLEFAKSWARPAPLSSAELLYPVAIVDAEAPRFRADMSLSDLNPSHDLDQTLDRIRRYWSGEIVEAQQVEVLVQGDLLVAGPSVAIS